MGTIRHVCDSSYLDNLELTDRVLGEITGTLKASPRWKDTTLVVQGDHSWRTETWEDTPTWTEEDDAASKQASFDPRPAVLIHQAGQTEGKTVGEPWSLIKVHEVLEGVLKGRGGEVVSSQFSVVSCQLFERWLTFVW